MSAKALISILLGAALCGCATSGTDRLAASLENRGLVVLSDENPYLAGNLFLSQQARQSSVLRGFLRYRGIPSAIELHKPLLSRPLARLYYPDSAEVYTVEDSGEDFVVTGPQRMAPKVQDALAQIPGKPVNTPVLMLAQVETPLPKEGPAQAPPPLPTRSPAPALKPPPFKPASTPAAAPQGAEHDPDLAIVRELQRADEKKPLAEVTPQGDVVHYVTFEGETLSMIARWYTHDRSNAARLARVNKLRNPDHLKLGDAIVVPHYLVKNRVRLSSEAIMRLRAQHGIAAG